MPIQKRVTLSSVDPFALQSKVAVLIADLNLCLGRTQKEDMIEYTSQKITEYLHEKFGYYSIPELDNIFKKIAQGDLGKVYEISFNSFCMFLKEYQQVRESFNKKKVSESKKNEWVEWSRSEENERLVKESLRTGVVNKKCAYTSEQLLQIDPEYVKSKEHTKDMIEKYGGIGQARR